MPFGRSVFFFLAEKKGFVYLRPSLSRRAAAQISKSRRIEELAHQDGCRSLLRERCAQRNIARSAKRHGRLQLAGSKVQIKVPSRTKARSTHSGVPYFSFHPLSKKDCIIIFFVLYYSYQHTQELLCARKDYFHQPQLRQYWSRSRCSALFMIWKQPRLFILEKTPGKIYSVSSLLLSASFQPSSAGVFSHQAFFASQDGILSINLSGDG